MSTQRPFSYALLLLLVAASLAPASCNKESGGLDPAALSLLLFGRPDTTAPELNVAMQINPEILERIGIFYHGETDFPELRGIADVEVVRPQDRLKLDGQLSEDSTLYILDAFTGAIFYSSRPGKLAAFVNRVDALKGAYRLAATSAGHVAVVQADHTIDACYRFNGRELQHSPCAAQSTGAPVYSLTAFDESSFLALSGQSITRLFADGTSRPFAVAFTLENPSSIRVAGERLLIVDRNQQRLSVVDKNSGVVLAQNQDIRVPIGTDGTRSDPIEFISIAPSYNGGYYGVSYSNGILVYLDAGLNYKVHTFYPQMPMPAQRMQRVLGVRNSGAGDSLLYVFSQSVITIYTEKSLAEIPGLERYVPSGVRQLGEAMATLDPETVDLKSDIFSHPEIQQIFNDEKARLANGN